jgi:DNA-binding protein H-NS
MPSTNINNFSIHQLLELRRDIDRLLQSKRAELRADLEELDKELVAVHAWSLKGTKVEPKYKDPKTGEKWSGRGRTPRWLVKELNAGRKKEDFLITDSAPGANAGTRPPSDLETMGEGVQNSPRQRNLSMN